MFKQKQSKFWSRILVCLVSLSNIPALAQSNPEFVRISPAEGYNDVIPMHKIAPVKPRAPLDASSQATQAPVLAAKPVIDPAPTPRSLPTPVPAAVETPITSVTEPVSIPESTKPVISWDETPAPPPTVDAKPKAGPKANVEAKAPAKPKADIKSASIVKDEPSNVGQSTKSTPHKTVTQPPEKEADKTITAKSDKKAAVPEKKGVNKKTPASQKSAAKAKQPVVKKTDAASVVQKPVEPEPIDPNSIVWDEPAQTVSTVKAAQEPVETDIKPAIEPAPEKKEAAKPDETPRQELGSMSGSSDIVKPVKTETAVTPVPFDAGEAHELEVSLMKKVQILEFEKEQLRRKVLQMDAAGLTPVYQCATEASKIKELESKVQFLTDDNQALRKKNEELTTIPKLDPSALNVLPDEKGRSKEKN